MLPFMKRISKQEEIDSILFAKIDQLRDKTDEHHNNLLKSLSVRAKGLDKPLVLAQLLCILCFKLRRLF